jgi:antitoxin HicB
MTEGDTQASALSHLEEAMTGWIRLHLEDGDPIPPPLAVDDYSGKFMVRIPKSLHRDLARRADIDGVSLNQYVSVRLALTSSAEPKADVNYAKRRDGLKRAQ